MQQRFVHEVISIRSKVVKLYFDTPVMLLCKHCQANVEIRHRTKTEDRSMETLVRYQVQLPAVGTEKSEESPDQGRPTFGH